MRAVVIALVLLFIIALGGLEILAARSLPEEPVRGAGTADILRGRGISLEP